MNFRPNKVVSLLLVGGFSIGSVLACGPFFPNTLLNRGDAPLLAAPVADFSKELDLLNLPKGTFSANPPTNSYFDQTLEAELSDIRASLGLKMSPTRKREILNAYEKARRQLEFPLQTDTEPASTEVDPNPTIVPPVPASPIVTNNAPIDLLNPSFPSELPAEFADYFHGMVNYRQGDKVEAEEAWQALLQRPDAERRYRTVWATYMLGRNAEEDSDEAIAYFQKVRVLAKSGFHDSLGLAEASIGWEARVYWKQGNFERAIELYLEQYAAGDPSATESLRMVARQALIQDDTVLLNLARHPLTQRVMTAYVISTLENSISAQTDTENHWLNAVERAQVQDLASAERLALAAYQSGNIKLTERWLKRASANSPTAQWVKAKLLLRAGKLDEAAGLLARTTKFFPIDIGTNEPTRLEEVLHGEEWISAGQQALGELGVLRLARREYAQSLDALLRAGFWMDAAYVAERVLTVDELKSYVDAKWPTIIVAEVKTNETAVISPYYLQGNRTSPEFISRNIRNLLARRLTRLSRGAEANQYFPPEMQPLFQQLTEVLPQCYDEARSATDRAHSFWQAAQMVRTDGMELLGTEVEPDWSVVEGNYDLGDTLQERQNLSPINTKSESPNEENKTNFVLPSADEVKRAQEHSADPEIRFHYRYIAADLAWHAAALLPNNSDETALILCRAGSWIKYQNPVAADRYYKALVRRCRQTALGDEADRIRWFPELDETGHFVPRPPRQPQQPVAEEATAPESVDPVVENPALTN